MNLIKTESRPWLWLLHKAEWAMWLISVAAGGMLFAGVATLAVQIVLWIWYGHGSITVSDVFIKWGWDPPEISPEALEWPISLVLILVATLIIASVVGTGGLPIFK
jgi:hypothetical protein